MRYIAFAICFALAANTALAGPKPAVCQGSPSLVAPCFTVHGRLSIYEGGWNLRIWPVGSHRLLAVVDGADVYDDQTIVLPRSIEAPLEKFSLGVRIFADYRVCPLTKAKPGAMQHVCVIRASHMHVVKPP
jgi:hypothetical protein